MAESGGGSVLRNLLAELRRRRVIRVAAVYGISGWVVIEVAATLLPALNLEAWTVTLVIALVVLGFPIAVAMAWIFDIGPDGVHRTDAVATNAVGGGTSPAADAPAQSAVLPTLPVQSPPRGSEDRRTIAVLPFVNMSGDPDNEYFSDGISEEILNLLAKLPQLKVASRTSSFNFKGKQASIPTVAHELGVTTVLEGSVRRSGNQVRITGQLIDAESDSHLWSETYDREMKDVFAIQDDIAQSIVRALQVTLTPKERRAMQFVATSNPEAYDFYLRGRNYMYSMARRDYEHAIRMFEQAIALDSKYALAYSGKADAYSQMYRYIEASRQNLEQANRASEQAIALDPDSAEARASRGLALCICERYDEAEKEFETATALNPNLFEAWFYHALACSSQGHFDQAIALYEKASEVNPADYQAPMFLAQGYASMGKKQEEMKIRLSALNTIEKHLQLNPHDTRALYLGANNLCRIGDHKRARELAERALKQDQNEPVVLYNVACFYALQGDLDQAITLLEKAVELGWGDRAWMETDSDLDPLAGQERFKALLERIDAQAV